MRTRRIGAVLLVVAALLAVVTPRAGLARNPALPECEPGQRFPTFSGPQFRDFVDAHRFLDTAQLTSKPPIYGHAGADQRIQSLAEARGYKLRSITTTSLGSADGHSLHPVAASAWRSLQSAARANGHSIVVQSGFRTIERQREIVKSSLSGYSTSDIEAGRADGAINNMLRTRSIPGYSRHHSAHAVDVASGGGSFGSFGRTAAFRWISADNYAAAKQHGFLPSYPAGAGPQGPDPEPWEFVHVGVSAIECPIVVGGAAAVVTAPDTLEVFVRGLDNAVWTKRRQAGQWSDWSSLGGIVTSAPTATVEAPGQVTLLARGTDRALWGRTRVAGTWQAWTSFGGILASAPAATSDAPGTLRVFAVGTDAALWLRTSQGWQSLGGIASGPPAAVSPTGGGVEVFIPGLDNAMWSRVLSGGDWQDWSPLGGLFTSGAGATTTTDGVAVLGRGNDGAVWTRERTAAGWTGWSSLGGIITSPPSAVADDSGQIEVFARGQDAALWARDQAGWEALGGVLR